MNGSRNEDPSLPTNGNSRAVIRHGGSHRTKQWNNKHIPHYELEEAHGHDWTLTFFFLSLVEQQWRPAAGYVILPLALYSSVSLFFFFCSRMIEEIASWRLRQRYRERKSEFLITSYVIDEFFWGWIQKRRCFAAAFKHWEEWSGVEGFDRKMVGPTFAGDPLLLFRCSIMLMP